MTDSTQVPSKEKFRTYKRVGAIEARPYERGDQATHNISISEADLTLPTLVGGMVARNPDNHDDMWYIAAAYFAKHYSADEPEVVQCPTCLEAHELLTRALIAADNNADGDLLDKVNDAIEVMERAAPPPSPAPTKNPMECEHATATFQCNDCGVDIRDARRAEQPPAVGPLKLDTERQVFFYEQDHYYLSNFSAFQVRLVVPDHDFGGERCIDFDTSEIAYHWFKFEADGCEYEGDHHVRGLILSARSSHEAFKIAEKWRDHRRPDWDAVKIGIMRTILWAKVGQHEYVYRKLLETGERELIENSWRDDFWGWGENRDGQNMLGKLWMQIRTELRASALTKGAAP